MTPWIKDIYVRIFGYDCNPKKLTIRYSQYYEELIIGYLDPNTKKLQEWLNERMG